MKFKHASPPSDPFYTCSTSLITTVHASKGVPGLLSLNGGGEDSSRSVMQPYGADVTPSTQLELYTLNGTRSYEIHCDGHLIKTISFQVNTTVVCE